MSEVRYSLEHTTYPGSDITDEMILRLHTPKTEILTHRPAPSLNVSVKLLLKILDIGFTPSIAQLLVELSKLLVRRPVKCRLYITRLFNARRSVSERVPQMVFDDAYLERMHGIEDVVEEEVVIRKLKKWRPTLAVVLEQRRSLTVCARIFPSINLVISSVMECNMASVLT